MPGTVSFPGRLAFATCAALLLMALLSPLLSIVAQPARTPHENPARAGDELDMASILLFYSNVFSQATAKRYQNAGDMLEELKYARMPGELRNVVERYSVLSRRLFDGLNRIEHLLNEASNLISRSELDRARQTLNEAETAILDAQVGLKDLELATTSLAERLGATSPLASSGMVESYKHLRGLLAEFRQLIDGLSRLRQRLVENPRPGNPGIQVIQESASFYYDTTLQVSAPKECRPGMPVTVTGMVSSSGEVIDRVISLRLDNTRMAEQTTRSQFQFRLVVPPQIASGRHTLTVVAAPVERYAGASWSDAINVSRIPVSVEAEAPAFNIMPQFQVNGSVHSESLPLAGARVTLSLKRSTATVNTAADGSFTATVSVPYDPSFLGPEELGVSVVPKEPYYESGGVNRWILILNPANAGLMLIALVSMGVLVYRRNRARPGLGEGFASEEAVPALPDRALPQGRGYQLTTAQMRTLSAYSAALRVVEDAGGVPAAPAETLREYASMVATLFPPVNQPFVELTGIVEFALYSGCQVDSQVVARAESLAQQVKESCRGAA